MTAVLEQLEVLDEAAARRELRRQIARLEKRLAVEPVAPGQRGEPRLLGIAELERVRDALAARLSERRPQGEASEAARVRLERMLADPRAHRRETVALHELGLPGCGVYRPRPRLGLVGRLAGWWRVKLSSGCP
jgi:hypothetical protein